MSNVGVISGGCGGLSTAAGDDFRRHDELPAEIRQWYANAKLLWVADDAWYWLHHGMSPKAVIAKLEATEQATLRSEADVWRLR